ncbi:kinase-like domain-containing protein [Cyathus striatus]|nr:kinase-like domain-containing protein [Cyathus striatus]
MRIVHHRLPPTPDIEIVPPQSSQAKLFFEDVVRNSEDSYFVLVSDPRTKRLNFSALFEVIHDIMKERCELLEWIGEGGRNQLYLAHLSSGRQVAARITFPYSYRELHGPEFIEQDEIDWNKNPARMNSEIQTIYFLKSRTDIPIPAIYSTNITDSPVGAPYSIQELVGGTNVVPKWQQLSGAQKLTIIQKLGEITGKLYSLEFESYGSIIDATSGAIGPLVDPVYCLHHPYPPLGVVGPWPKNDPFGIFVAFATREYRWLESDLGKRLFMKVYNGRDGPNISADKAWETRVMVNKELVSLIPHLPSLYPLPHVAHRPTLAHPDYRFANILISDVDPTNVTGIIDWEYAAVLPLWYTHSMLQSIEYVGEELYINNPHISEVEENMLREEYIKSISQTCSDFQEFLSDVSDWGRKANVLHDIIGLAGRGNLLGTPISIIKDKLELALREVDNRDYSGLVFWKTYQVGVVLKRRLQKCAIATMI